MSMLECTELILGYGKPINTPFNLTLKENAWVGIIGENGIGKSTFLKTILGFMQPISGKLKVLSQEKIPYAQISYIPQEREINLSNKMSGLSLILNSYQGQRLGFPVYNREIKQEVLKLIELVGATSYLHQSFYTLSGGQKKRIYLAQALINKPRLLLLDEPLADLDPQAKQHFIAALEEIHKYQELGLMIISHDMHEIAHYLDGFIHFKQGNVHYCNEVPCVKRDVYVGI